MQLHRERQIFVPPGRHRWWQSHAQGPTVLVVDDRLWRVYFAARDSGNRSRIAFADFDPTDGFALLRLQSEPVLDLGPPGAFDSSGTLPSAAVQVDGRTLLYYIGFSLRQDVPHQLAIGLAVSSDGGVTFQRAVPGPVLAIGPFDPYFLTTPFVLRNENGFRMHYASCFGWRQEAAGPDFGCQIKTAYSPDGIHWQSEPGAALPAAGAAEAVVARPALLVRPDGHHMWFCCRGWRGRDGVPAPPYRLGYAHSVDGVTWRRQDEALQIENPPRPGEWDAAMQAYPYVIARGDEILLFYNGNGFGRSGFGVARIRFDR
jgi:hypothetical protein